MIVTYSNDKRNVYPKNLGNTTLTVLVPCLKATKTLESVSVACGATGADFTLVYNDGTNDYYLENARPIAANASYYIKDHLVQMKIGDSIKVKASAADRLSVIAVTIDTMPQTSATPNLGFAR